MAASHPPGGLPELCTALALHVGDWLELDGKPWQITDLRFRCDGGRVVHLAGRPPFTMGPRSALPVYRHDR
ncbi:hypothetical protein [Streptacidiphilus jiangxiensis]|uniref:Uncharacterized protein n=1 Tax=Streptacidiphilus jiangxiensis TaxID=235985 RepID=A0A1H7UWK5_STRJI|nr:hypothetical protein [Streptacidiphilus jiangxiensis]SEM01360.1 hypothetical protein SAMN05414137_116221 [Streptacidiphilus jiangxiensis]